MTDDLLQFIKYSLKAKGIKSPLVIDEFDSLCRTIAAEEPIDVLTTDKLTSVIHKIRKPAKEILRSEFGFECLMVLLSKLGDRWGLILAEILAEDQNNIQKSIEMLRSGVSTDMARPLFFVCNELKRRHREIFVKEFITSLNKPWAKSGLILALPLFDSSDTELVTPLTQRLQKIEQISCSTPHKKERDEFAKIIKDTLRKITHTEKKRKFWQFWKK